MDVTSDTDRGQGFREYEQTRGDDRDKTWIFVRCRACGLTWLCAMLTPTDVTPPRALAARVYCPQCDARADLL